MTYIPTASKAEKLGFFVKIGKWTLRRLGLTVDELDTSFASYETAKMFYLLQELKRTGTDKLLADEINKGKLYIGESAGAILTAPDIGYSAEMDNVGKAPDLKDYSGLNVVDFYVVPHYKNWEMGKAAQIIIDKYSESLDLKVINDKQAIFIDNDKVKILDK